MIGQCLSNKNKSATILLPKKFWELKHGCCATTRNCTIQTLLQVTEITP